MIALSLLSARIDLYERAWPSPQFLSYVRAHQLDIMQVGGFVGGCGVIPLIDCGCGRFDFANYGDDWQHGFVCEAYGDDGETVIDLVAWPIDDPAHVMSMFGRCGLLGAWEAMMPATYFMGGGLQMHRTPLGWLQSGCRGAAVVTPHIAARMLVDVPGRLLAEDVSHGRKLRALTQSVIGSDKILVPDPARRAAP